MLRTIHINLYRTGYGRDHGDLKYVAHIYLYYPYIQRNTIFGILEKWWCLLKIWPIKLKIKNVYILTNPNICCHTLLFNYLHIPNFIYFAISFFCCFLLIAQLLHSRFYCCYFQFLLLPFFVFYFYNCRLPLLPAYICLPKIYSIGNVIILICCVNEKRELHININ